MARRDVLRGFVDSVAELLGRLDLWIDWVGDPDKDTLVGARLVSNNPQHPRAAFLARQLYEKLPAGRVNRIGSSSA